MKSLGINATKDVYYLHTETYKHQDEMEEIKDINKWKDTRVHGSEDLILQT